MNFLVENFTDLADLQCYVAPMESIYPPQKSEVVPMKILFKDEMLKSDTTQLVARIMQPSVHLLGLCADLPKHEHTSIHTIVPSMSWESRDEGSPLTK